MRRLAELWEEACAWVERLLEDACMVDVDEEFEPIVFPATKVVIRIEDGNLVSVYTNDTGLELDVFHFDSTEEDEDLEQEFQEALDPCPFPVPL